MNYKKSLALTGVFVCGMLSAQVVNSWQFDDASGTPLPDLATSGSNGVAWEGDRAGMSVSGGSLNLTGDIKNGVPATYASPIAGSGAYRFEVSFSSWDFSAWETAGDDGIRSFTFGLSDSSNKWIARIYLRWNGQVDAVIQTNASTSNEFWIVAEDLGNPSSGAVTVAVEFDFDLNVFQYVVNGEVAYSFDTLNATDIGGFAISRFGPAEWNNPSEVVSVDFITLEQITDLTEPPSWAGYPIEEDGVTVDTGAFMGVLDILHEPWVWSYSLEAYIYLPEANVADAGAWSYVPR